MDYFLIFFLMVSIFGVEVLVIHPVFPILGSSPLFEALFDSTLLVFFLSPFFLILSLFSLKSTWPSGEKTADTKGYKSYQYFFLLIFSIFIGETLVMYLIHFLPPFSPVLEAFVDSTLLVALMTPVLFFFLYRPMKIHIVRQNEIELELERRIEESTGELKESEERFRNIVTTSADSIIVANARGEIVSVNPETETMFGHMDKELIGKTLTTIIPERYRERHLKGLASVAFTGESKYLGRILEFEGLRMDGSEFPLELNVSHWKTKDGIFFGGTIRDITDRKKTEEELHRSAFFLETIPEALLVISPDIKLVRINPATSELLKYKEEEILGKSALELFQEEERSKHERNIKIAIETDEARVFETIALTKCGKKNSCCAKRQSNKG